VTSLFGTRVSQQTAGKISADLANIRTQFTALTKQVSGLSAESGAVSGLLKALGADAQDLASHPTAANEATLSSAISSLKALGAPLLAELKTSCPGS
jgi:ABC-type transporter Mla subunit MlaD